jgi:hypothetical protein
MKRTSVMDLLCAIVGIVVIVALVGGEIVYVNKHGKFSDPFLTTVINLPIIYGAIYLAMTGLRRRNRELRKQINELR